MQKQRPSTVKKQIKYFQKRIAIIYIKKKKMLFWRNELAPKKSKLYIETLASSYERIEPLSHYPKVTPLK